MLPELITYAVAALLLVAAVLDARIAKIPNWLPIVMVAVFVAKIIFAPQDIDILWQIVFAAGVFIVGFGLFMTGGFGAGAVKLMGATALFMPLDRLGVLSLTLLAAVIGSLILFGMLRAFFGSDTSSWTCLQKRIIPMAFPIMVTGLVGLFVL